MDGYPVRYLEIPVAKIRRRLVVVPHMVALWVAALLLYALLQHGWELAAFLLPFNGFALFLFHPLNPVLATRREGVRHLL